MCIIGFSKVPDPIPTQFWKVFEVREPNMYASAYGYFPFTTYGPNEWVTAEKPNTPWTQEAGFHAFIDPASAARLISWLTNVEEFQTRSFIILPVEVDNILFFGRDVEGEAVVAERMRICVSPI